MFEILGSATDPNAILKYVSTELTVEASFFSCVRLVKHYVDVTILRFVNLMLAFPISFVKQYLRMSFG